MTPTAAPRPDRPAPSAPDARVPGWDVVIPVKPLHRAKSRLGDLGDPVRRDLALAFLRDVLAAVGGVTDLHEIVVVTSDERVSEVVREDLGERVRVVADAERTELNHALHRGVAALPSGPSGTSRPVLALCADLPSLTTAAVTELLAAAPASGTAFVADHTGAGTTAYLAATGRFSPHFGVGSRAAHAGQGAVDLTGAVRPELRADVDTPDDLWALPTSRLGAATRAALVAHGLLEAPSRGA